MLHSSYCCLPAVYIIKSKLVWAESDRTRINKKTIEGRREAHIRNVYRNTLVDGVARSDVTKTDDGL